MIILRNKYFSNEESKNKNKKLAIGATIGTAGGVAGGIAGKILGNRTHMDAQEKSIYERHKGSISNVDSAIQYTKKDMKAARRLIRTTLKHQGEGEGFRRFANIRKGLVKDPIWQSLSSEEKRTLESKLGQQMKQGLEHDAFYQVGKRQIERGKYNLDRLKNEKSTLEKILKRKKANSRIGLAIGAGAGAALATGAYLLGNKYTVKSKNS